ncbi:hypothetical protein HJC23_009840 [Cyclotella cryptica]|uniref:Uncharacterized protein n=1 Tax=Cyclotella cryptica TaxID=29204 RepID=A0ABD3NU35_9STRA
MNTIRESDTKNIVILTLKKHEDGVWVQRLLNCLELIATEENQDSKALKVEVRALETWMEEGWIVSSPNCFDNIAAIVNRVSDAASPSLFKATLALLGAARSFGIPIVNGPETYAMCGNKWCHHMLFSRANLKSPSTLMFWNEDGGNENTMEFIQEHIKSMNLDDGYTLLAKPNSGGFGTGIRKLTMPLQKNDVPAFEDCITLLQKYEQPRGNKLYRVWFLRGKVQCAVERELQDDENQFTNACSGSCSLQRPPRAWRVPMDVKDELEGQLLPLLTDAHCGSIEFLYSKEDSTRLYFDLNLLSTLPLNVLNEEGVWEASYDPWMEQAAAVWEIAQGKNL